MAWAKVFTGRTTLNPRNLNRIGGYDFAPYPTGAITPGAAFGYLIPGVVALDHSPCLLYPSRCVYATEPE